MNIQVVKVCTGFTHRSTEAKPPPPRSSSSSSSSIFWQFCVPITLIMVKLTKIRTLKSASKWVMSKKPLPPLPLHHEGNPVLNTKATMGEFRWYLFGTMLLERACDRWQWQCKRAEQTVAIRSTEGWVIIRPPAGCRFRWGGVGFAADVKRSAEQHHGQPCTDNDRPCDGYGFDMRRFGARLS